MSTKPRTALETHDVFNQAKPLVDKNLYLIDQAMIDCVRREAGDWLHDKMSVLGAEVGSAKVLKWGEQANTHAPELQQFNRFGERIDHVEFHPAYHALMGLAMDQGVHDVAFSNPGKSRHAGYAAMVALFTQADHATMCPVTMTYAAVPALRKSPEVGRAWIDKIIGGRYDAPLRPIREKSGVTIGMAMTEKQGGSDVRANTTTAKVLNDGGYALTGHKWFCSAPMSDGFLTLAYLDNQMTCFLVPRVLPDGTLNTINVMRLKDKLGNRGNASSEIEYHGAWAERIGDPGAGVKSIIEMVHHTRLGAIAATVGIMRMALAQAINHTSGRMAFQKRLIDQPVMRAVLADLQVEYEAAIALVIHVAARIDRTEPEEQAYARLAVALAKYLLTKRCPNFVYECLECHGGAGYIEEGPLARLYREAPLNAIWEGSGNVIALDVMRTLAKEPEVLEVFLAKLAAADPALSLEISDLFKDGPPPESAARKIAERMALALQAAILTDGPMTVSDAHRSQLLSTPRTYGGGLAQISVDDILERARF